MVSDQESSPQAPGNGPPDDSPWALLAEALTFLTRLPVPGAGSLLPLARAMPAFPLAGALIGGAGAIVYALVRVILPIPLAAILAQAALCLLTGALHEDGLADTADGLGARGDRARRLEVMRDARIGVFGTVALVGALAIRVAALTAIGGRWQVAGALIAAHALSRAVIPGAMHLLVPARNDGLGAAAAQPSPAEVGIAATMAVVIAALVLRPGAALAAVIGALLGAFAVGSVADRAYGGYTGDVLGAIEQAAESFALVAIAAVLS